MNCFSRIVASTIIFSITSILFAQVLTTGSINGVVSGTDDLTLEGANVMATHVPSGTSSGATSRSDGSFNIPNLKVGGPYTVMVSYIGYKESKVSDIYISLGENRTVDFSLSTEAIGMAALDVVASRDINKTGAGTQHSEEVISNMPNVERGMYDIAKLNPYVVEGGDGEVNIAGKHPNYNTVKIDGAVLNDVFGLADNGLPGDQAGTQPISLDAIEELQVAVSPFDVRQHGFTGGALNAVTRSGTNEFEASAYMYTKNESYIGDYVEEDGTKNEYPEFSENVFGVRTGGPIIKDKMHYFINLESSKKSTPNTVTLESGQAQSYDGGMDIVRIDSALTNKYGVTTGGYSSPLTTETPSLKFLAKVDYNLNDKHRLSFRHNMVNATDDINARSTGNFYFGNAGYVFNHKQNSSMLHLYSSLNDKMSNEFTFGYTTLQDFRDESSPDVPTFNIGFWAATAGAEQYSIGNKLDQDILQISDNFTYYLNNKHTLATGFSLENYSFTNGFFRNFNGTYYYGDEDDLISGSTWRYELTYSAVDGDPQPFAKVKASLLGFYGQDTWKVNDQLRLTSGLRLDIPTFPENPAANDTVAKYFSGMGLKTDQMPSGNLHVSPRVGFNYTMKDQNSTVIRGGAGVFSGSPKFVWMSNNYSNSGMLLKSIRTSSAVPFSMNRDQQITSLIDSGLIVPNAYQKSEINLVDKDLKFPQVMRTNLAIERKLPFGLNGTFEFLYTKTLNDYKYQQINAVKDGTLMDGRDHYTTYGVTDNTYHVMLVTNTDQGHQYNLSGMVDGSWNLGTYDVNAGLSYTNSQSKDINSLTSSQARSNWKYNPVGMHTNEPNLTSSNYEVPHRIVGSLGATFNFVESSSTTFSFFYEGQSGRPFSYKGEEGDIDYNGDGDARNDLIFVFNDASKVNMVDSEGNNAWDAWTAFVNQDDALKEYKGKIIDRNAGRQPWRNRLDLRITQKVFDRVELTFDILNFANLLSSDAGKQEYVSYGTVDLLEFTGFADEDDVSSKPTFVFDKDKYTKTEDIYSVDDFGSRWQMLLGLRINI
tara:strand:+ start:1030 stop:4164 length:3135 start_codon:yes stop_codon:yes gene_type:complete